MDHQRDFDQEEILGDIIRDEGDVVLSFLNDIEEGLQGEEAGCVDQTMEEGHDRDGGSGGRDDGSVDRTELGSPIAKSGEVYIYIIKHVLTS